MAENLTLIDFIRELLGLEGQDKAIELRDYFEQNPQAALNEYGLGHLSPEDVHDAIVLYQDNDTVSFDRNYDTGSNGIDWSWGKGGLAPAAHHAGGPEWREHVSNNHVTNNIDDRDTILDQSVNQNIDTDGGDFNQSLTNNSTNATGDGAVAAGDDIRDSTITTGDDNVVGNANQVVSGDDNVTAFGEGSAVKGVSVDNGGAFSVNGNADGDASVNGSYNQDNSQDNDTTEITDSGNVDIDNSLDTSVQDNDGLDLDLTI